jgi:hypothetical protein
LYILVSVNLPGSKADKTWFIPTGGSLTSIRFIALSEAGYALLLSEDFFLLDFC